MTKITIHPRRRIFPYVLGVALLMMGYLTPFDALPGLGKAWILFVVVGVLCMLGNELMHQLAHLTVSQEEVVCRSALSRSAAIRDITQFLSETDRTIHFKTRLGRDFLIDLSMFHRDQRLQARKLLRERVPAYADAT